MSKVIEGGKSKFKLTANLKDDLLRSIESPYLIWVSKKDYESLSLEIGDGVDGLLKFCKVFYDDDSNIKSDRTNIIYIDSNKKGNFQIAEALHIGIDEVINDAARRDALKTGFSTLFRGGVKIFNPVGIILDSVSMSATNVLEPVLEPVLDTALDSFSYWIEYGVDNLESRLKSLANKKISDIMSKIASESFKPHRKDQRLAVPASSREQVVKAMEWLNDVKSPSSIDVCNRLFQISASFANGMPKLLVVDNPHRLDDNSIEFIAHSICALRDLNERRINVPLSIMLTFSDDSTHSDREKENLAFLGRVRMFAGRYSMLETPSTTSPRLAVREGVFVGRREELKKLNDQSHDSLSGDKGIVASVVSAGPGMGKTVLCQKHIEEFFNLDAQKNDENALKCKGVLRLEIRNHHHLGAGSSGMVSLLESLEREQNRLINSRSMIRKLKDAGIEIKDEAKQSIIQKKPSDYFLKKLSKIVANNIIVDFNAIHKAWDGLNNRKQRSDDVLSAMEGVDRGVQEDYLKKIAIQIDRIAELAKKLSDADGDSNLPIFILLDDFQWLDEESADFILNYLAGREGGLRLLVTVREGDAANPIQDAIANPNTQNNFITLANLLGVRGAETLPASIHPMGSALNVKKDQISLSGFDEEMLASLIDESVNDDERTALEEHPTWMSEAIVDYLKDDGGVVSLFAIETLNLLADPMFNEQLGLQRCLIEWQAARPRFSEHAIGMGKEAFLEALKFTLGAILDKYKDSIHRGEGISVASHAILEERILLIHDFVKKNIGNEAADYAVAYLTFTSLSPDAFQSSLIARILNTLLHAEDPGGLGDLPAKLKKKLGFAYTEDYEKSFCDTFEQTYELISQVSGMAKLYAFRHSLFPTFLDAKINALLDEVTDGHDRETAKQFKVWVYGKCLSIFDFKLELSDTEAVIKAGNKQIEKINNTHAICLNIAEVLLNEDKTNDESLKKFVLAIMQSALFRTKTGDYRESIRILEHGRDVIMQYMDTKPEFTESVVIPILKLLAENYSIVAIPENALEITSFYYEKDPDEWATQHSTSLFAMALKLATQGRSDEGLSLIQPFYDDDPSSFGYHYDFIFEQLIRSLLANKEIDEALSRIEQKYLDNSIKWGVLYARSLNVQAEQDYNAGNIHDAIDYLKKAVSILIQCPVDGLGNRDCKLSELSQTVFNNLINLLTETDDMQGVVDFLESARKQFPDEWHHKFTWSETYDVAVEKLATTYIESSQFMKLNTLLDNVYNYNPDRWAGIYAASLGRMGIEFNEQGKTQEAINKWEKSINVLRPLYLKDPDQLDHSYTTVMDYLIDAYFRTGEFKKCALVIKPLYSAMPDRWIVNYLHLLQLVSAKEFEVNKLDDATESLKNIMELLETNNIQEDDQFIELYVKTLMSLGSIADDMGELEAANDILGKAVELVSRNEGRFTEDLSDTVHALHSHISQLDS